MANANTIKGTSKNDKLQGTEDDDDILGLAGNDQLFGDYGNDTLEGGNGNDILFGGDDIDVLQGGNGKDTFLFKSVDDAPVPYYEETTTPGPGTVIVNDKGIPNKHIPPPVPPPTEDEFQPDYDSITDFHWSEKDKIDLKAIDANESKRGDQAFNKIIDSGEFDFDTSFTAPGQLFFDDTTHILYGNVNDDAEPEFAIFLNGVEEVFAKYFAL